MTMTDIPTGNGHKMIIVSVEGIDKSGKCTAAGTLTDYFKTEKGLNVARMEMPDYSTPIGALIRDYLTGDLSVSPETFELLLAADKQAAQSRIAAFEAAGVDVLVMDRYVHSQIAYGAYHVDAQWLSAITSKLRLPDAVIYLDVEPEVSMHRKGKFGDNDKYEGDLDRLRATRSAYLDLFKSDDCDVPTVLIDATPPEIIVRKKLTQAADAIYDMLIEGVSSIDAQ